MRWLIDGYNVIRRDPELRAAEVESLEAGRRALLHLVAAVAGKSPDDFTIVFDGAPVRGAAASGGRVAVIFSRPPETADDLLLRLARQAGAGAAVVSSDRRVRDGAGRVGCAVVSADQFLEAASGERADGEGAFDEDDDDAAQPGKRGNPRRLSREARATQRALRRLRRR